MGDISYVSYLAFSLSIASIRRRMQEGLLLKVGILAMRLLAAYLLY